MESLECEGKGFQTGLNVNKTDTFNSTTTGLHIIIYHQFKCNYKYLGYLVNCKVCLKQYAGQTIHKSKSK